MTTRPDDQDESTTDRDDAMRRAAWNLRLAAGYEHIAVLMDEIRARNHLAEIWESALRKAG